jgi:hypothetical protein
VVGGYIPGPRGIDSIIIGFYWGDDLVYVTRVRNGFVPGTRRALMDRIRPFAQLYCPFINLPETQKSRWGESLDAKKMRSACGLDCK